MNNEYTLPNIFIKNKKREGEGEIILSYYYFAFNYF